MEAGRNSPELANLLDSLTENDPHRVVEMGRDVEGLTANDGWLVVARLLAELRQRGMDQLLRGGKPLEQAQYAQQLGFLNGVTAGPAGGSCRGPGASSSKAAPGIPGQPEVDATQERFKAGPSRAPGRRLGPADSTSSNPSEHS
jgi:hypothetical protein